MAAVSSHPATLRLAAVRQLTEKQHARLPNNRPLRLSCGQRLRTAVQATPGRASDSAAAEWEFNTDLVDAPHTIRTWDVYRIVQSQKVEKQIKDMTKFEEKLSGEAAQQCKDAIAALELAKQALEADASGMSADSNRETTNL
eukprot:CAMPEP_0177755034 /NCGR_PEP_ID=MMETSP0491_2-20121128/2345_1 /TAXON_ID=63592 /ORGANISM="Tetraselmis chuii, Strain PLY429" /LENGTH=141 /DNA_ID=CAMNT_0019270493 /DNA_START=121 /DNA_END=547 /DNA_ORIENTATION=+